MIHILSNIYLNASKSEKSKINELDDIKIYVIIFLLIISIYVIFDINKQKVKIGQSI